VRREPMPATRAVGIVRNDLPEVPGVLLHHRRWLRLARLPGRHEGRRIGRAEADVVAGCASGHPGKRRPPATPVAPSAGFGEDGAVGGDN
jgi:hypothetical protein